MLLLILRILLGGILFWTTTLEAQAEEPKVNNTTPICLTEQIDNRDHLNPAAQKMQTTQKTEQSNQDEDTSEQDEDPCKVPETSESADGISDETVEEPEPSEAPTSEDLDQPYNPSIPDESDASQPSINNYNLNFSLELGGASSGGDESFPDLDYSASEPETFSPIPPLAPPATPTSLKQPTLLLPSPSEPRRQQIQKSKSHTKKHHKTQKQHKHKHGLKHEQRKRSHQKLEKHWTQKAPRSHKPQKRQVPTHQIKGRRMEPPPFRPHITPHRNVRPSVPRLHRVHRRH